jgi:hypothetical protein
MTDEQEVSSDAGPETEFETPSDESTAPEPETDPDEGPKTISALESSEGDAMTNKAKPAPKLNDDQVSGEIVNDSLGTVDQADTTDTDPKDDPETRDKGVEGAKKRTED